MQTISVIIPVLNEAGFINTLLKEIRESCKDAEIIVVDGGSGDGTVEIAERCANKVLSSPPSRGRQLGLGLEEASGDIILFLHADLRLPDGWNDSILRLFKEDREAVGGAFGLKMDTASLFFSVISFAVRLRSEVLGVVYGDQGIFAKKDVLDSIGGIREQPIFEDVELWKRLKKKGRVVILKDDIITSTRRWKSGGILYTTLKNWLFYLLYLSGLSPDTLYRLYYRRGID